MVVRLTQIDVASETLAAVLRGEPAACEQLYHALAPALFGLIRRLIGATPVAEDLFQDTMLIIYQRLSEFRGEAPLGAWARQIAVSKCLMYLRSPWHRARLDFAFGAEEEPAWLCSAALPAPSATAVDLERALASLSPTARAVVWLYEVEGYSHLEIAHLFGRTVSFSKSQLARAHERLRAWLEPQAEGVPCP